MTKELSKDVKTNVVIFWDSTRIFITQIEHDSLNSLWADHNIKMVKLSGNYYAKAQIAKVLTLKEFYAEYPDQKPETPPAGYQPVDNKIDYRSIYDRVAETVRHLPTAELAVKLNKLNQHLRTAKTATYETYITRFHMDREFKNRPDISFREEMPKTVQDVG